MTCRSYSNITQRDRNGTSRQRPSFSCIFSCFPESNRSCKTRDSWANEEFWHEMMDSGEIIQPVRVANIYSAMMYVVTVFQTQSHMPQDSKCIPNFLCSWYKNSNNNLFTDNGKTFINWPKSIQTIVSSWPGMKPLGNISASPLLLPYLH